MDATLLFAYFVFTRATANFVVKAHYMLKVFTLAVLFLGGINAYCQEGTSHEPTSATDSDVKLHNNKKSRFVRGGKARKTEREGSVIKDSKYVAEARSPERHGKSLRKSRGTRKLNGEARVFRKHGVSSSNKAARKMKVRRSFGRSTEE